MKIVVTGSLGHISKPLSQQLIREGHLVTVVSSSPDRRAAIEGLGAKAAIGKMQDAGFLTETFAGADAVYVMESLGHDFFFQKDLDFMEAFLEIGNSYKNAILRSGTKRVVHLSSIGGHTDRGNGMLRFHHGVEQQLKDLPDEVSITTLRPVGFYYNLLSFIPVIRQAGVISTNYKAVYKEPWVSPADIAGVVAEEITREFSGRKIRYIASDELTGDDIARVLGKAIGIPELKWVTVTDDELLDGMLKAGMNRGVAEGLTEMNAARQTGTLFEDYWLNRPVLGKVKLTDYADEFAAAYHRQNKLL